MVNMEATDVRVYSFIHKLLCGGCRRIVSRWEGFRETPVWSYTGSYWGKFGSVSASEPHMKVATMWCYNWHETIVSESHFRPFGSTAGACCLQHVSLSFWEVVPGPQIFGQTDPKVVFRPDSPRPWWKMDTLFHLKWIITFQTKVICIEFSTVMVKQRTLLQSTSHSINIFFADSSWYDVHISRRKGMVHINVWTDNVHRVIQ